MKRCVVNVSTGPYVKGLDRLKKSCEAQGVDVVSWRDNLPPSCPPHRDVPYAFKAYALAEASKLGYETLLWCDASVYPIKPLGPLFERIERDGYWMSRNGYTNYEWTADSAYPDLFPANSIYKAYDGDRARQLNRRIEHVVAGTFGISMTHHVKTFPNKIGQSFLDRYLALAKTKAFCGPWTNGPQSADGRTAPCGPPDVSGHRHDQTAASVIAWRLGFTLTSPPDVMAYVLNNDPDERTILLFDGAY